MAIPSRHSVHLASFASSGGHSQFLINAECGCVQNLKGYFAEPAVQRAALPACGKMVFQAAAFRPRRDV